ncbi:MAG: AMP-binding protein, partial [Alphaproteobacteria bacterium]|nr:AMP-binding protein [Alphaproteobacteria bacterium]MDX5369256.1 AMP-binding protein [Alphaproteobacteria bacterium]MDX5463941.1 AMP-binding protein [Alphaproteobacteria bacterium]
MNAPVSATSLIRAWPVTADGGPATLVAAVACNAAEAGKRTGFRERDYGIWREWTWSQILDEVLALAAGFEELGLKPGAALTVVGDNRVSIYLAMLAANALRAYPSPVFSDVPVQQFSVYMSHGDPDIAVAEDQEQVDKLLEVREQTGRPSVIVYDDKRGLGAYEAPGIHALEEVAARGRARLRA